MEENEDRKAPLPLKTLVCPLMAAGGLLWILAGRVQEGVPVVRPFVLLVLCAASLGAFLLPGGRRTGKEPVADQRTRGLLLAMTLLLLSWGTGANLWFFYPDWSLPGTGSLDVTDSWILRSVLLFFLLLLVGSRFPEKILRWGIPVLLAATALLCFWRLGRVSGFAPLYSVDHPSFYYRYTTFLQGFPDPGFYDPNWNAGQPVPYLVASGVWSLALVWLPLLFLVPLDVLYTPMLGVTFLLIVPASGYAAARLFGLDRQAALITALFFMVPGKRYFTHILNYGTVPSMFCLCLIPLVLALFWKVFHSENRKDLLTWTGGLTGVSLLVLCWPGSLLTGAPLGAALLSLWRKWTVKRIFWLCITAGLLVLLLTPLAVVPIRYSPIGAFFDLSEPKSLSEIFINGRRQLAGLLQGVHPLLLGMGVVGLWLDPNRERRRVLLSFWTVSVFLAGWGEEIRPLLQWERLIIPATLVTALPAGRLISDTLNALSTKCRLSAVLGVWMMTLLLLGSYQGMRIYGNRDTMRTRVMPDYMEELVRYLSDAVPEGSRVLIAGKAVHAYGGGKVAALPVLIDREMIAADYYGFSPKLVEYQCPPRKVLRQGPEAVLRYLDLHQVSQVMTYQDSWKAAFERHPDWYTERRDFGEISVYRVIPAFSPILGARGTVQSGINRLTVSLEEVSEEVVLKYNWAEGWTSDSSVEMFPKEMEFGLTFIGIRPHGERDFMLRFDP